MDIYRERDVMSRFLAMPTAAAAMERIDPAPEPEPEPAPAPAAEEQKQLDKVAVLWLITHSTVTSALPDLLRGRRRRASQSVRVRARDA